MKRDVLETWPMSIPKIRKGRRWALQHGQNYVDVYVFSTNSLKQQSCCHASDFFGSKSVHMSTKTEMLEVSPTFFVPTKLKTKTPKEN